MICKFCGKEITEGSSNCIHCGRDQKTAGKEGKSVSYEYVDRMGALVVLILSVFLVMSPILKLCKLDFYGAILNFSVADVFNVSTDIGKLTRWDYVLEHKSAINNPECTEIFAFSFVSMFFHSLAIIALVVAFVHFIKGQAKNIKTLFTCSMLVATFTLLANLLAIVVSKKIEDAFCISAIKSALPLTGLYYIVLVMTIFVMVLSGTLQGKLSEA